MFIQYDILYQWVPCQEMSEYPNYLRKSNITNNIKNKILSSKYPLSNFLLTLLHCNDSLLKVMDNLKDSISPMFIQNEHPFIEQQVSRFLFVNFNIINILPYANKCTLIIFKKKKAGIVVSYRFRVWQHFPLTGKCLSYHV